MIDKIRELLDTIPREEALKILAEIVDYDYELPLASSLIKKDCDPYLDKEQLIGNQYGEGNENAGYLDLSTVLEFVEEVLNCDDSNFGGVEFQHFVRPETEEETEEAEHDKNVIWFTEDTSIDMDKLLIQFEIF